MSGSALGGTELGSPELAGAASLVPGSAILWVPGEAWPLERSAGLLAGARESAVSAGLAPCLHQT